MADDGGFKGYDAAAVGEGLGDFWGDDYLWVVHSVTVSWFLGTVSGCQVGWLRLLIAAPCAVQAIGSEHMAG